MSANRDTVLSRVPDGLLAAARKQLDRRLPALLKEPKAGAQLAKALTAWMYRSLLNTIVEQGFRSAKGFAAHLLDARVWREAHLEKVPHFGAIAPLFQPATTRRDYVGLVLGELLRIKKEHPQLGLSSASGVTFGNKQLSRLELAQTWAIGLNLGHLFATFSSERALLVHLAEDPAEQQEFLHQIDPDLRPPCEDIVFSARLHRSFYALAAWRASALPGSATRGTLLASLAQYLLRDDDDPVAVWAFRRARQLAYHRLHSFSGLGSVVRLEDTDRLAAELLPDRAIHFHEHSEEGNPLVPLLDRFDDYAQQAAFSRPEAAALVLAHNREFKQWWRNAKQGGIPLRRRVESLFQRPADWPRRDPRQLQPYVRLELPGEESDWLPMVLAWQGDGRAWRSWHFLVTPFPRGRGLLCDVYWDGQFSAPALRQAAIRLGELGVTSWSMAGDAEVRRLWRSFARFGATVLQQCLKDNVRATIKPVGARGGSYGYALLGPDGARVASRMRTFLGRLRDEVRRRELRAVLESLQTESEDPCLVFLGNIEIVDGEGDQITDLDGVWAFFHEDYVQWNVLEHKSGKGSARGQLDKFREHLRVRCNAAVGQDVAAGRAARLEFQWPPR